MEKASKDALIKIALLLDLEDILPLCKTSSKFNEMICKNDDFWKQKLLNDYDIFSYEVPKNTTHKNYYRYLTEKSIIEVMYLKKIKLLEQKIKPNTYLNNVLLRAFEMNWQEAVELLIDNGANLNAFNFLLMNKLIPNYSRSCQGKHRVIPIIPGSDEYWINKGHKLMDHNGSKFICTDKELTPFLKTGNIPCCH